MPVLDSLRTFSTKTYIKYAQDPGKALLHLGALGWVLSAASQVFMICTSKNIDKDKKKFLIPQEIADGVVNVGLSYTITAAIKSLADNLVEKPVRYTEKTYKTINDFKNNKIPLQEYLKNTVKGFKDTGLISEKEAKTPLSGFYTGVVKFLENSNDSRKDLLIKDIKAAQTDFKAFKSGVGIIAAIGASVLASSIITPIVRNKVASCFQKKDTKETQVKAPEAQYYAMKHYSVPPVFGRFKV